MKKGPAKKSGVKKSLKKIGPQQRKVFGIGGIKKSRSKSPSGVSASELETLNLFGWTHTIFSKNLMPRKKKLL